VPRTQILEFTQHCRPCLSHACSTCCTTYTFCAFAGQQLPHRHLAAVAGPAMGCHAGLKLNRCLLCLQVQGPDGWRVAEGSDTQTTQELLPQQLQDMLVLALAALPDPGPHRAVFYMRKLAQLLELLPARRLSTQALQSIIDIAFKVRRVLHCARALCECALSGGP
jgi:hypothetical protein